MSKAGLRRRDRNKNRGRVTARNVINNFIEIIIWRARRFGSNDDSSRIQAT
jgi:hypothetical protein